MKNDPRYRNNYRNDNDYDDNNYPSRNQNYNRYVPKRKTPTWALVTLGIIGGAAASVGTTLYINKHEAATAPQQTQQITPQQETPQNNIVQQPTQQVQQLAKVLNVTPNYTTVDKPVKVCNMEESTVTVLNKKSGTTGSVIGGTTGAVAGGIIGNQIKQGGGGTIIGGVLGAATGALIGNEVQKANQPEYITKQEQVKVCHTENKSVKQIVNYDITYSYNGQTETATSKKSYKVGSSVSYNKLQANFVR